MGSVPSVRVPFDNSVTEGIDASAHAAKAATEEYRKLEKAMLDTITSGQKVSQTQANAVEQARIKSTALTEAYKKQRNEIKSIESAEWSMQRKGARAVRAVKGLTSDPILQKMARGERIKPEDIVRGLVQSEHVGLAITRALGGNVASFMKATPVIREAVESIMHTMEVYAQTRAANVFDRTMILKYKKGLVSGAEMELYNKGLGYGDFVNNTVMGIMGTDPRKNALDKNEKITTLLANMSAAEIDRAGLTMDKQNLRDTSSLNRIGSGSGLLGLLNPLGQLQALISGYNIGSSAPITDEKGKRLSGEQYKQRIQSAIEAEKRKRHQAQLPKEIEDKIRRTANIGVKVGGLTVEEFEREAENRELERRIVLSPSQEFHKKHREQMYNASLSVYQKRVPANPTD